MTKKSKILTLSLLFTTSVVMCYEMYKIGYTIGELILTPTED